MLMPLRPYRCVGAVSGRALGRRRRRRGLLVQLFELYRHAVRRWGERCGLGSMRESVTIMRVGRGRRRNVQFAQDRLRLMSHPWAAHPCAVPYAPRCAPHKTQCGSLLA